MRARATSSALALIALLLVDLSEAWAGESAESIFPEAGVASVSVSPRGDWIAAKAHRDEESLVIVQRVGLPGLVNVAKSKTIGTVAWEAPDTLVIEAVTAAGLYQVLFVRLSLEGDKIAADHRRISAPGFLVDPSPLIPEQVLWLLRGDGWTSLHRISIDDLLAYHRLHRISGKTISIAERLAVVNGPSSHWITERDGTPRAALRQDEEATSMLMPAYGRGPFETVHRFRDDEAERSVVPVGLTQDESHVIVLAYGGKNTKGLYEWDQKRAAVGSPVFVHADFDLSGVLTDPLTGDLVAAMYEEGGETRFHYFAEYRDRFLSKLPDSWRKDSVAVVSGSADRQVFALFESSATNPGDFFVRDRAGEIHRVGRVGENVDRAKLSPVDAFRVKSRDGVEIEAYLTLPRGRKGRSPLVVLPHGGPHSTRDSRQYDPLVQYLASFGFAALQVNYRGSGGYGLEFEVLGKKEWARGIEDDIDAAVEHAMGLTVVDGERICIVGGSYGGFSALASVVRHRDRYRCAVSINGVSDVPLLFDSSDSADSKSAISFFKEYVGDPETERDKLLEISPAYHVRELETPILIIQGTADRRVDSDHAHRMALMLELYGKPHELLLIEGAEHSLDRDEWIITVRTIRRFLTAHLVPEASFEPDPSTRYDH